MTDACVARFGLTVAVILVAAGCAGQRPVPAGDGPGSAVPRDVPADAVPRAEARSRYGNGPEYEVFGVKYRVMDSSHGYVERGVASWYGKKFHGRLTSSREPYDMYAMTAAHKSLPLPTYVEVRNLQNDRRIVVRVNDRGPFVKNRLIDLSYAAAHKLGIVRNGTGMVEVRAISFDDAPRDNAPLLAGSGPAPTTTVAARTPAAKTRAPAIEQPEEAAPASATAAASAGLVAEGPLASEAGRQIFVQVGAFGDRGNAERRHRLLAENGIDPAFVYREADRSPALYRVRVGPLDGVEQYDRVIDRLSRIGIDNAHLVSE